MLPISKLRLFKFLQIINMVSCFFNLSAGLLLINSGLSGQESLFTAAFNALAWWLCADAIEKIKTIEQIDDNGEPLKGKNDINQ
jgi:hypothetical protein